MSRAVLDMARIQAAEARIAEVLNLHPEIRQRTAAWLASEPTTEEMEVLIVGDEEKPNMQTLGIRIDQTTIDRADALQSFVATKPELRAMGRVSRASILRLAMLRGLEVLEADKAKAEKAEAKGKH